MMDDLLSAVDVVVQGAIAGSAPVGSFVSKYNTHHFDPACFWEVSLAEKNPRVVEMHT
jgi:hypothetical protein